jgi:hypothetical protein
MKRRAFLQSMAVVAAGGQASRSYAADDVLWKLWTRYVTGGVPYRPSFAAMFLDPMFVQIEVVAADLGLDSYSSYNPLALVASPPPAPSTIRAGGFGNAAPILADNPPDTPWIPSTQAKSGVRTLMPLSAPVYSVLILNDQTDWPETAHDAVKKGVDAGKGFVILHHAFGDNQKWPWWYREVTGGHLALNDHDGLKKAKVTPSASLEVRPVGNHPIIQDVGPLHLTNEVAYKGVWQAPNVTPLMETRSPASDRVVAWISPHPTAKVVCIQPGASSETHRNPAFRKLVRNAVLWAGGRLG